MVYSPARVEVIMSLTSTYHLTAATSSVTRRVAKARASFAAVVLQEPNKEGAMRHKNWGEGAGVAMMVQGTVFR